MSEDIKVIRWEKHYSDGSVEIAKGQSAQNFEDNIDIASDFLVGRSYIQINPVEWEKDESLQQENQRLKDEVERHELFHNKVYEFFNEHCPVEMDEFLSKHKYT